MAGGAGGIGVLEGIGGAVQPRPLAVPIGKDAIGLGLTRQPHLLTAPDGGGRQILVEAGLEVDVVQGQMLLRPPQFLVQA